MALFKELKQLLTNPFFIGAMFSLTLFQACLPTYIPSTQQVPLLSEKGETNVALAGNSIQQEVLASHAITDEIGLTAYAGLFGSDLQKAKDKNKVFELGAGYFKPVGKNFVFETYGLLGYGTYNDEFTFLKQTNIFDYNSYKVGLQTNFGFKHKNLQFALSSKLSRLTYFNISQTTITEDGLPETNLSSNYSSAYFEPAATLKLGIRNIQLQAQYGRSFQLTTGPKDLALNGNFTVGANLLFNTAKKNK